MTDIAVFRPSSGTWFVRSGITVGWRTQGDSGEANEPDYFG